DLQTSNNSEDTQVESPNLKLKILVIALFFFSFVGVELGFGDWISTYAIRMGIADERAAVFLASAYWGAFTISRLISIPLSNRFQPQILVLADLIGSFIGLGMILVVPGLSIVAWCGTIILGLSMASLFPTMLTLADNLVPMTGKITSWFLISGSIGSMLVPWLIGRNVESSGPLVIIQVLFILLLISVLTFFLLSRLQKKHPQENLRV
ncbi:MAG: MFS transporter, partial [Anaerolineales bacterium]|nr:MFS transporter [Anaerolineales bacterium]